MKLIIKLAWRSIWRNRRRTILTISAIAFATLFLIIRNGLAKGTYDLNFKNIMKTFSGALQIQRIEYKDNPSIYKSFIPSDKFKNDIRQVSGLIGFTPRIESSGLISYKSNSNGIMILGVSKETEIKVTTFLERIKEGVIFDTDSSNQIVVGYKLLKNLGAKIGDKVVLLSQGFDGTLANRIFTITGVLKTGNEMDNLVIVMGLSACQDFLGMNGRINSLVINVYDVDNISQIKQNLFKILDQPSLTVLSWDEILVDLKQYMEYDDIKDNIVMGILVVIVAFSILNTILMSVTERFREFGISLSIGMRQSKLVAQVIYESFFITIMGIFLGNIIGGLVNLYVYYNPIDLGGGMGYIYEEFGFLPRLEASLKPFIFINTSFTILILFFIACIYPVYKVFKLEPLKGIRYT